MKENNHHKSERELLEELLARIDRLAESLKNQHMNVSLGLIPNAQLQAEFGITDRTARIWCEKGILRPIKIEGRIYFKLSDVQDMIREHFKRA